MISKGGILISQVVEDSIRNAFPKHADDILKEMWWDGICNCWLFTLFGMTVGCESDGYIHS